MRGMRKHIAGVLVVAMATTVLSSCGTITRAEDNTLTMNFAMANREEFTEALQRQFPDIRFEIEQYRGINSSSYNIQRLTKDDVPDIFVTTVEPNQKNQKNYLLDVSGYEFTSNYHVNILSQVENDGGIYILPTTMVLRTMAYNKTLFEEKGWEKPHNHQELVELIKQIRKESDITPIAFSGRGTGYYFSYMTTLAQCGYLSTAQGKEWQERYMLGEASAEEGFGKGIALLQDLMDADAFDMEKYLDDFDVDVAELFVKERDAAMMVVWGGQNSLSKAVSESTDEIELFPFFGEEDGTVLIGIAPTGYFALSKRLGEKGNEKKLENALRVMEWICSEEGGLPYMRSGEDDICPMAQAACREPQGIYEAVWHEYSNGYKAPMLYTGYEDVMAGAGTFIRNKMMKGGSLDGLTELIDEQHKAALMSVVGYGEIAEDFTLEETAQLQANILNNLGIADFAMISLGGAKNGVSSSSRGSNGRLYAGKLKMATVNIVIPGGGTVCILTLTGEQIKDLLENGKDMSGASFEYYWSGIDVEMQDGKVSSIKLDGKELGMNQSYTVAFSKDDYSENLKADIEDTGIVYLDVFKQYLLENSPVAVPQVLR